MTLISLPETTKRTLPERGELPARCRGTYVKLCVERSSHRPEALFDQNIRLYPFIDEIYVN